MLLIYETENMKYPPRERSLIRNLEGSGGYWKSTLVCVEGESMRGYGGLGAKAVSEAGFREMGKSLGLWEKMISNIWRSLREFRSLCGVLSLPVLFQQIVKLTDIQSLDSWFWDGRCYCCCYLNLITETCDVVLLLKYSWERSISSGISEEEIMLHRIDLNHNAHLKFTFSFEDCFLQLF